MTQHHSFLLSLYALQLAPAMPLVFFFNDTATTEIYTLSLHDALPISGTGGASRGRERSDLQPAGRAREASLTRSSNCACVSRSEEHTSELQSRQYLVCRLLLEKKKKKK